MMVQSCSPPEKLTVAVEAGACRSLAEGRVVPLLLRLTQSGSPLSQFQLSNPGRYKAVGRRVKRMTSSGVSSEEQQTLFNALWPQ